MPSGDRHLTAEEVGRILEIVQSTDAIVVGGQSVNLWAQHYAGRRAGFPDNGPYTSKDVDFFRNARAAVALADALGGTLMLPKPEDATPNAAVVIGMLADRKIEVDFMTLVLGVDEKSITTKYVTLGGMNAVTGSTFKVLLLHPLDCLRSRFANINTLHREDELSLRQAQTAIAIVKHFIDDLLEMELTGEAQRALRDLCYVTRDGFIRGDVAFRHDIDPLPVLRAFLEDPRLDERWRTRYLAKAVARLEKIIDRRVKAKAAIAAAPARP